MPAFTRENLPFSFTFFGHCIPLLYPSDKNGHNVRIPFRCRCALSAFPPKRQAHSSSWHVLRTLIDAGWGGGLIRFESLLRSRGNAARRILRIAAQSFKELPAEAFVTSKRGRTKRKVLLALF